jgi:diguanylate cyclase (GGDEF)-like protein
LVLGLCVASLVLVVSVSAYLMTDAARTSMSRQVITRETAVAVERAAQVAEAVEIAHERLRAAAALPGGVAAVERGDFAFLELALLRATTNGAVTRAAITIDDRVVARSPQDEPAVVVDDDATHIESSGTHDAGVTFNAPIRNARGETIARLHEEVSLTGLVPRLAQPLFGGRDVVSLVRGDGAVLVSSSPRRASALTAPALLDLVADGRTGGARYSSDELGDRIASVAPVPGQPWAVLIDADASEANAPAGSLVARMLIGFAVMIVLGGTMLWIAAAAVLASRRQLQHAHDRSLRDATTDSLTGAGNRRAFEERLVALRDGDAQIGVVIVDIDRLKSINDAHGHAMGDVVIRRVADAIHAAVRSQDAVYRIGGDEFAVIVGELSADSIHELATRISQRVAAERLNGDDGLQASVGAAAGPAALVDDVLHQADIAMYEAKREARARP